MSCRISSAHFIHPLRLCLFPPQGGFRPIHLAAQCGHRRCLQALLVAAAADGDGGKEEELSARSVRGGDTALHVAAAAGETDCAELLLQEGAEAGALNALRRTPLHAAAAAGAAECLGLLLERCCGADASAADGAVEEEDALIDAADEDGATALHLAAAGGHIDCVEALIEAGADFAAENDVRFSTRTTFSSAPVSSRPPRSSTFPAATTAYACCCSARLDSRRSDQQRACLRLKLTYLACTAFLSLLEVVVDACARFFVRLLRPGRVLRRKALRRCRWRFRKSNPSARGRWETLLRRRQPLLPPVTGVAAAASPRLIVRRS